MLIESLLRTTQVARIYVLLRPKRGQDTAERAQTLLKAPLFHLVRRAPALAAKVVAVAGDISLPGLGLSAGDLATLEREANFIIHSAADIRLEPPMQETLRSNYLGTKRVLQLAARCLRGAAARAALAGGGGAGGGGAVAIAASAPPALRCVVHVSTCYTNIEQPRGSSVAERLYPLRYGEQAADAEALAEELLALPAVVAEERAATLMARWNFPNTYCFGKRLTELMAARLQAQHALPMAIVRPSLVGSLAGAPLPGYTGNWAGPAGMGAALAIGIHPDWKACSSSATSVWDVVPGDVATAGVLAAAAAVAQGLAPALRAATGCGTWDLPGRGPIWCGGGEAAAAAVAAMAAADDEFGAGAPGPASAAGAAAALASSSGGGASSSSAAADATVAIVSGVVAAADEAGGGGKLGGRLARAFSRGGSNGGGRNGGGSNGGSNNGGADGPPLPGAYAGRHLAAAAAAAGRPPLPPAPPPPPLIIVHSATSTLYPGFFTEGWNIALDFFDAFPPKHRIAFSSLRGQPRLGPTFVADMAVVNRAKYWCGVRIHAIGFLLRLFGQARAAEKLVTGHMQWAQNNDLKTDRDLWFRTDALRALDAALPLSERRDYLVVWRPAIPGRPAAVMPGEEAAAIAARLAPGGALGDGGGGGDGAGAAGSSEALERALARQADAEGAGRASAGGRADPVGRALGLDGEDEFSVGAGAAPALHPADGMGWVQYGYSNLAGLYHMMYGCTPVAGVAGSGRTRDGRLVEHAFEMPARPTAGTGVVVAAGGAGGGGGDGAAAEGKKKA